MYTVKQLADLAGVSVRTLHYYDEIGLLRPTHVGSNAYRYYDETAVLRLQQILFYRELDIELTQIRTILDDPSFDVMAALRAHRAALGDKMGRPGSLLATVDNTLKHLSGETAMSRKKLFEGFTPEEEAQVTREARLQYDPQIVNESVKRWKGYTPEERQIILREGGQIYQEVAEAIEAGLSADSAQMQALVGRWHEHIRYYYEPTLDILRGLSELYNEDARFQQNLQQFHAELPSVLRAAIHVYVDALEDAELRRLLAADEAARLENKT